MERKEINNCKEKKFKTNKCKKEKTQQLCSDEIEVASVVAWKKEEN